MPDVAYYSKEGFEALKAELHDLKTSKRSEIAHAIQEAREKGDLSENAEYDAAKDAQGLLELRISELETLMANARLLESDKLDNTKVYILSAVKLEMIKAKKSVTYKLVSAKEANLKDGKISVDSPIGQALLGRVVGDQFTIKVPAGEIEVKILEISR
jgi:transcription elongation factor GreA